MKRLFIIFSYVDGTMILVKEGLNQIMFLSVFIDVMTNEEINPRSSILSPPCFKGPVLVLPVLIFSYFVPTLISQQC